MSYNVSGWGTAAPKAQIGVGYLINGGQDLGAQFAQAKPEGATQDGTQNGSFTSYNRDIYLEVATQKITYSFLAQNTSPQDLSFMLCAERSFTARSAVACRRDSWALVSQAHRGVRQRHGRAKQRAE
jgi:hypothetical protein